MTHTFIDCPFNTGYFRKDGHKARFCLACTIEVSTWNESVFSSLVNPSTRVFSTREVVKSDYGVKL